MENCPLCSASLRPVLAEGEHWRLVLNYNQDLLGKCFLALRRHAESITLLSLDEWTELHRLIARATGALVDAFAPDHFNYAFLQNQDRHVHLHIIPRYASMRTSAGVSFHDPAYPGHYAVNEPALRLDEEHVAALAQLLRTRLA
ncbi:MAG TPA: HIT family protein [Dehalococcoidia bacterium]|nr:HIT family protein [Dehalococcoidia bacterium]